MSAKRQNKKRFQITLSPDAARAGRVLAKAERRNFSNMLEVLIDRAAARKSENGKAVVA